MPPTAELPGPAFQPNMPTYQQGQDPITQNCSCPQCSAVQHTQAGPTTWDPIEQQDQRHLGVSILYDDDIILHLISLSLKRAATPYLDQGQEVGTGIPSAAIVPEGALALFIPPQTTRIQENFGYAPVHERDGPPNMGLPRAQTLDAAIAEARRRLAGHYLNNPDAYVSTIRLTNVV